LIEIGLVVVALLGLVRLDDEELRRVLAQMAKCPRVVRVHLVIDAPERIPGGYVVRVRIAEFRTVGKGSRLVSGLPEALEAPEEEQLVT
jgi:hypothetical protein